MFRGVREKILAWSAAENQYCQPFCVCVGVYICVYVCVRERFHEYSNPCTNNLSLSPKGKFQRASRYKG